MKEDSSKPDNSEGRRIGEWVNLMGTDLQMKIINQDNTISCRRPCEVGDALYIEFQGRQAENREHLDGVIFQDVNDWLVVIGDKDTTPALEMGLRFMMDGDTCMIYSDAKFAYGVSGRAQNDYVLPSNSNVLYKVRITKLVPGDSDLFRSPAFQIELARSKKSIGNDCFQNEWCNGIAKGKSIMLYKKAADAMANLMQECKDEDILNEASAVYVDCLNNIAAVYLKAKEYGKAKDAATKVILRDPNNMKALLRAAHAALLDPAGTFEECSAAIAAAEQVDPADVDLRKLKMEYRKRLKDYKERKKELLSKMSSAMASKPTQSGLLKSDQSEDDGVIASEQNSTESTAPITKPLPTGNEGTAVKKIILFLVQVVLPWLAYYIFWLLNRKT